MHNLRKSLMTVYWKILTAAVRNRLLLLSVRYNQIIQYSSEFPKAFDIGRAMKLFCRPFILLFTKRQRVSHARRYWVIVEIFFVKYVWCSGVLCKSYIRFRISPCSPANSLCPFIMLFQCIWLQRLYINVST